MNRAKTVSVRSWDTAGGRAGLQRTPNPEGPSPAPACPCCASVSTSAQRQLMAAVRVTWPKCSLPGAQGRVCGGVGQVREADAPLAPRVLISPTPSGTFWVLRCRGEQTSWPTSLAF